jgi:hypothetical protein
LVSISSLVRNRLKSGARLCILIGVKKWSGLGFIIVSLSIYYAHEADVDEVLNSRGETTYDEEQRRKEVTKETPTSS